MNHLKNKAYEYASDVVLKKVVAPKYVIKQCEEFLDIANGKNDKYIINEDDLYYYNVNNSEQKEEKFILKERFIGKREKIKFLLSKRKNKVNNEYTIENFNDKECLITKKEELKLRNRKAAQKSRDKKRKIYFS